MRQGEATVALVPEIEIRYTACNDKASYTEARQACLDNGGSLAQPKSQQQQQAMDRELNATLCSTGRTEGRELNITFGRKFWIGLTRNNTPGVGSPWVWEDGAPLGVWANWGLAQPNNWRGNQDCVQQWLQQGKLKTPEDHYGWNDGNCSHRVCYVCENLTSPATTAVNATTDAAVTTTSTTTNPGETTASSGQHGGCPRHSSTKKLGPLEVALIVAVMTIAVVVGAYFKEGYKLYIEGKLAKRMDKDTEDENSQKTEKQKMTFIDIMNKARRKSEKKTASYLTSTTTGSYSAVGRTISATSTQMTSVSATTKTSAYGTTTSSAPTTTSEPTSASVTAATMSTKATDSRGTIASSIKSTSIY